MAALVRFSKASGKPTAHDAGRDGGGMAVKLRSLTEGDEWDLVAVGPPVFVSRTVEDFLELLRLRKPDPDTGQPDMEKLGEFLGRHPEAQLAIQSTLGAEPAASFVTVPYHSPHAFRLSDASGGETWVRWRWRPVAGEERISDDEARERGRDYLGEELESRLAAGTAAMELIFQIATGEDSLTDPTELWPDERETIVAGTLELTAVVGRPRGRRAHRGLRPHPAPGRDRALRRPDPQRPAQGVLRLGLPPPRRGLAAVHNLTLEISVILLGAVGAQLLAAQLRIPAIVPLLIVGVALGPYVGDVIDPDQLLGDLLDPLVALAVGAILFDGSLSLHRKQLKQGAGSVVLRLTTLGLAITWGLAGAGAALILGIDHRIAIILGAVLTLSGPTVVLPLLDFVRAKPRPDAVLRWEGILVDPIGAILAVLVFHAVISGERQLRPPRVRRHDRSRPGRRTAGGDPAHAPPAGTAASTPRWRRAPPSRWCWPRSPSRARSARTQAS